METGACGGAMGSAMETSACGGEGGGAMERAACGGEMGGTKQTSVVVMRRRWAARRTARWRRARAAGRRADRSKPVAGMTDRCSKRQAALHVFLAMEQLAELRRQQQQSSGGGRQQCRAGRAAEQCGRESAPRSDALSSRIHDSGRSEAASWEDSAAVSKPESAKREPRNTKEPHFVLTVNARKSALCPYRWSVVAVRSCEAHQPSYFDMCGTMQWTLFCFSAWNLSCCAAQPALV